MERRGPVPYTLGGAMTSDVQKQHGNWVVRAQALRQHYKVPQGMFRAPAILKAVDGASFELARRKTLAVVGESGCGKSTLARMVTMIEVPASGTLEICGETVVGASTETLAALRPRVQIVFQNPYGSLNPRHRIGTILEEPLLVNTTLSKAERAEKARAMMAAVGLRPEHYDRYPHMFSGGQRQRIAIARALMLNPDVLVLDEPVSALDISIQAQVLNLLAELQEKFDLAYLFISHDLAVVRHIADDVMVMYLGKVVEQGPAAAIFAKPLHPYTQALLSATPQADPTRKRQRIVLEGELPSPLSPPQGCPFHPRCPVAVDVCRRVMPELETKAGQAVACHVAS
jgi:dipeptide transport system ATP-binding protein